MTLADAITVIVPTSPIPSHPSTAVIGETLDSLAAAGLDGCEVIVCADGVRAEQEHRRGDYEEYLRRLLWDLGHRWRHSEDYLRALLWGVHHGRRNHLPVLFDEHHHQAAMTRHALDLVRTPLVLFVEHDTPLVGEIPWMSMVAALTTEACGVDVIRLHHEADVLVPHRYLMVGGPQIVAGVPLQKTAQWSNRPHLANAAWYRAMLDRHFPAHARTMIEDRFYSEVSTPWIERREWGNECRLWMYAPDGDRKRSTHLDGRAGEDKYEMTW